MIDKAALEWHRPWPRWVGVGNRHDLKRWMRRALECAAVANDAMAEGRRAIAAIVLLEVMHLDAAIRITAE